VIAASVRVQAEPFDAAREEALLTQGRRDVGALVTFTGLCRDEDGVLAALEIEHYPGMAAEEIARVANEAAARWPVLGLTIAHRFGVIRPGDKIVLVVVAARHRGDAFAAAEFLMDYLKTRAPFWKKEHRSDGAQAAWVEARAADDAAAERWEKD
jgi:molybdopterin synthase catalytic subunit